MWVSIVVQDHGAPKLGSGEDAGVHFVSDNVAIYVPPLFYAQATFLQGNCIN